ncbi:MAG: AI-2E family transporter, partial [Rikenellaceae bacterium]
SAAAFITLLAIWAIFATLFSLLVPLMLSKLHELSKINIGETLNAIETPLHRAQHNIQTFLSIAQSELDLGASISKAINNYVNLGMVNNAFTSIVSIIFSSVISLFSISFITFFFLKEDGLFVAMISGLFPSKFHTNIERALTSISNLLGRYFIGIITESIIIGSLIAISMLCFGMGTPNAIFIGVVMGVLNVIPYAGPSIGAMISIFLGTISPIETLGIENTLIVIISTILVIKFFDDFFIQPLLYSERVKAHPLEIFLVILISGHLAGVVGMLLAIPSYTVIRVFGKEFFSQYSLVRRLTKEI